MKEYTKHIKKRVLRTEFEKILNNTQFAMKIFQFVFSDEYSHESLKQHLQETLNLLGSYCLSTYSEYKQLGGKSEEFEQIAHMFQKLEDVKQEIENEKKESLDGTEYVRVGDIGDVVTEKLPTGVYYSTDI